MNNVLQTLLVSKQMLKHYISSPSVFRLCGHPIYRLEPLPWMKSSSVLPSSPLQQIPENNVSFKVSSHSLFSETLRPSGSSYLNSKYGSGSSSHLPGLLSSVQSDSSVQLLSCVWLFVTLWTVAHQASLSPTPEVHSNSCSSSRWCHPTISSSVVPFSCLQSFPASGAFPMR